MEEKLRELLALAKGPLKTKGLELTGLHYFATNPGRVSQKKCRGLAVCFDIVTNNPNLFGMDYQNWRRVRLLEFCFEVGFDFLTKAFPGHEVWLDTKVRLQKPVALSLPFGGDEKKLKAKSVDVTGDNDVYFMSVEDMLARGEMEAGCTLHQYAQRYGLDKILKHGWHCISPDSSSVEALEAICDTQEVWSVLEVGAGVGVCGVAAQRRGIRDFTFVDTSPIVCQYLAQRFPEYKVTHGDAFKINLDRHWDVVLIGIPYELNPWLLAERGAELARHCQVVVFQSGCTGFFEYEHDWIMGSGQHTAWDWWRARQTADYHFGEVFELALDWQICVVAGHDKAAMTAIGRAMTRRGFSNTRYTYMGV